MKRIALALIACAGLGLAARQPVLPSDSRRSEPVRPALNSEAGPVETPLVEKLIVKEPAVVKQSLTTEPVRNPYKLVDGQLSPRGEWRWSQAQGAWVPVAKAGPRWVENGHSATINHLVREHGYSRASLERLTQAQLDVLHSNAHNAARAAAPVRSSGCPGGVCPNTSYSRGLFRGRR